MAQQVITIPLGRAPMHFDGTEFLEPRIKLAKNVVPTIAGYEGVGSWDTSNANLGKFTNDPTFPRDSHSVHLHIEAGDPTAGVGEQDEHDARTFAMGEDAAQLGRLWAYDPWAAPATWYTSGNFDHGAANAFAGMWDFCSWGHQIIATNYSHAVQEITITDPAPAWAALIDSVEKPKARFCMVIRNQLVLGKIDNSGGAINDGVFSDMVWWSGVDDATDFDPNVTTQSDYQQLVDSPGVITGLHGGSSFGLVFKATSVYRMEFVGAPAVYSFELISSSFGTKLPGSIIRVGEWVYFLASGAICRTDGVRVEKVGSSNLFFHRRAQYPILGYSNRRAVTSAFDPVANNIWWSTTEGYGVHGFSMVFNLDDGRASIVDHDDIVATAATNDNFRGVMTMPSGVNLGQRGFGPAVLMYDDSAGAQVMWVKQLGRQANAYTLDGVIETGLFAMQDHRNVQVHAARLLWKVETADGDGDLASGSYPTDADITIETVEDPAYTDADKRSESNTYANAQKDGWIPYSNTNGEFFKLTITIGGIRIDPTNEEYLPTLSAVQLLVTPKGAF
jgi:hypothetical protein